MSFSEIFSGKMYDFASPFEYSTQLNRLITNLGLFTEQPHATNRIAIDKIMIAGDYFAPEKSMYAQSDWNSASRPTFGTELYDMVYTNSINSVTSLDLEQYRARGHIDIGDQVSLAISDFSDAQYSQVSNSVEMALIGALLDLRVPSKYAEQGDLDFLAGADKTRYEMDVSAENNIFQQLSEINRIMNVNLGEGLAQQKKGMVVLAAGEAATSLRYHESVKDFMVYTLSVNDADNFATRVKADNPALESWTLNGITVIDVTGITTITDRIGKDGFVCIPVMSAESQAFTLHTGKGVRHAVQGKGNSLMQQYVTVDQQWGFPTVSTESAFLPVVNIPTAIVFGSITGFGS
ncbi:hypothetical protein SR70_06635 [Klebsiella aerogenes]|uniref:hypothetical protein n=1 Tax=Klebsiella aerogenes TaxID=548 RepID=UPI0005F03F76|nr:hypothetical protein [Klebsiella aerogenes]KJP43144.1 hypothetical protein SR70_06635 [Klebsiella aerogenes]